ncbi:tRNA (guanine-N(7)-)-methyltransferase (tRNA(m7G46)-methyltransferase) [Coemansia sp. RSA 988]|nr:tRNA (guanine-N(7)-)-methyltransferase (tRNA(m7G46)-methyltransferase) [Coemansia sp. RSA 988]
MYTTTMVGVARAVLGYALVLPVILGTVAALLLATNISVSYWFQRRREKQDQQRNIFGRSKTRGLGEDPPVQRIPRLQFALRQQQQQPRTEHGASMDTPVQLGPSHERLGAEVGRILRLVVRDFVESWFSEVSTDVQFPRSVYGQLTQTLEVIFERVDGVDKAEFIATQVAPLVTAHIRATRAAGGEEKEDEGREDTTETQHPGLKEGTDERSSVLAYVRKVVDLVVPLVLPAQASFAPHRILVRELISGTVLTPVLLATADSDTANQLLDSQLARLIREQHMVSELRDALDQQAAETSTPTDDTGGEVVRTYEQFMTTIDRCTGIEELERIREDIVAQIRKRRILIMGQNKDDIVHGQRVGDVIVYINRLYVAKKKADRRLELLQRDLSMRAARRGSSGSGSSATAGQNLRRAPLASRQSTYYEHRDDPARLGPPQFGMREILTDVGSLSAFAEYMDHSGQRLMLEFWLNVEGVRGTASAAAQPSTVQALWKNYFTLRVDELAAAAGGEVEACISQVQRRLKQFRVADRIELDAAALNADVCSEAFALICQVQDAVFRFMEGRMLEPFLRSALYTRVLKEYYVTSRKDQMEATLFARQADAETAIAPTERRDSTASLSSLGSGAKAARRWSFALRGSSTAPLVGTTTASAVMTSRRPSVASVAPVAQSVRSQPGRVVPVEVRRLSASLHSIAQTEDPDGENAAVADGERDAGAGHGGGASLSAGHDSRLDSGSEGSGDLDSDSGQGNESSGSGEESADEAEALVLARVVRTPTPGDLFLDARAEQAEQTLERKAHQLAIVRALRRQARRRGRENEQRVLRASERGLRRELRAGSEQQRLFAAALDAHRLHPQRTRVRIPRAVTQPDSENGLGEQAGHVSYLIEMQQSAGLAQPAEGWVVARRYREFHALHRDLRTCAPAAARAHELPARTPLARLQRARDVETRREALECYLQGLLRDARLCGCAPLRLFLSSMPPPPLQKPVEPPAETSDEAGWMAHIRRTVAADVEGVTGAESMLDVIVQELGAQVALQQQQQQPDAAAAAAALVDPLGDLFVETFGLSARRNWLRRQAVSILLRHIVGGAVERRLRQLLDALLGDGPLASHATTLRTLLWPNPNARLCAPPPRSAAQRTETRAAAQRHLLWYVPRLLAAMVGRTNARDGAQLLFAAVQNRRRNLRLVLSIFDALVVALFPELRLQLEHLEPSKRP